MKILLSFVVAGCLLVSPLAYAKHHKHHHKHHLHVKHKQLVINDKSPFYSPIDLISDEDNETIFVKNTERVVSIASITKLMVAALVAEKQLPLDEKITLDESDAVSHSKLKVGEIFTRGELLNIALMASDNRAAHALARTYPGGLTNAVFEMNNKAQQLTMTSTSYVEPTGLDANNKSTASDLQKLLAYARKFPILVQDSTMSEGEFHSKIFHSTNVYVRNSVWGDIVLSKTGTTNAAGRCVAVVLTEDNKDYEIVILGAQSGSQRIHDLATAKKLIGKNL